MSVKQKHKEIVAEITAKFGTVGVKGADIVKHFNTEEAGKGNRYCTIFRKYSETTGRGTFNFNGFAEGTSDDGAVSNAVEGEVITAANNEDLVEGSVAPALSAALVHEPKVSRRKASAEDDDAVGKLPRFGFDCIMQVRKYFDTNGIKYHQENAWTVTVEGTGRFGIAHSTLFCDGVEYDYKKLASLIPA